jgi:hypothetical protein
MHVRFGSKADICSAKRYVRFTPKSGHSRLTLECPLSANSGHRVFAKAKDQRVAHKGTTRKEALALQLGLIGLGGLAK